MCIDCSVTAVSYLINDLLSNLRLMKLFVIVFSNILIV